MRPAALLDALEEALARQDDEADAIVWSERRSSMAIAEQLVQDVEERQVRGADRPDDDTRDDVRDVRELAARTVGRGWALAAPAAPIVQARAAPSRPAPPTADVQRRAEGVSSGRGGSLPFLPPIQASFGRDDVTSIDAHVGGEAASDAEESGSSWRAPSRIAELLTHLKEQDARVGRAGPDRPGRAAARRARGPGRTRVFRTDRGLTTFRRIGLPPGAQALVGSRGQTLAGSSGSRARRPTWVRSCPSRAQREQILAAAEHLVGLRAVPASALGSSGST